MNDEEAEVLHIRPERIAAHGGAPERESRIEPCRCSPTGLAGRLQNLGCICHRVRDEVPLAIRPPAAARRRAFDEPVPIQAGTVEPDDTRARITHMMDLTLLAPDIQEQILTMPRVKGERGAPSEKRVRRIAAVAGWEEQRRLWRLQSCIRSSGNPV